MAAGGVLLLTGVPGIGKTTVIRRVAGRLKGRRLGGFYTEERVVRRADRVLNGADRPGVDGAGGRHLPRTTYRPPHPASTLSCQCAVDGDASAMAGIVNT